MAIGEKVRQTPEDNKRFYFSKEKQFAKEKMEQVQAAVREMKKSYPEILSFCAFGSMVKGTAREKTAQDAGSDIDGYLFIDFDIANKIWSKSNSSKARPLKLFYQDGFLGNILLQEVEGIYKNKFAKSFPKDKIAGRLDLHIQVLPVSQEIIDKEITRLSAAIDELDKTPQTELKELLSPITNLFAMFHLDVGGGVKNYRRYLLQKLNTLGKNGEKIWSLIIKNIEFMEQNFKLSAGRHYPKKLSQALEVYGAKELK